jgi:aryl-alcohol dehydrogenase-like predicted oxidoreductase
MQNRRFGRLGWQVSEVGYGLWGMGGWSGSDDDQSVAALDYAVEQGCTFFDTALAYGDGRSEQLLGQVLKRHPRNKLTVATKIPPKNGKWPALPEYKLDEVFPADHILAATETSLKNLGVETIDLQQFHVWTDEWAADDRWQQAVDDLKRQKLIKGFGISINRWEPTNVLRALDTGLVDSVQVVYNIFDQNPEDELFPACRERDIAVIARVPFDEGSLAEPVLLARQTPRHPPACRRPEGGRAGRNVDAGTGASLHPGQPDRLDGHSGHAAQTPRRDQPGGLRRAYAGPRRARAAQETPLGPDVFRALDTGNTGRSAR